MAPEGASINVELIIPQNPQSLEEVYQHLQQAFQKVFTMILRALEQQSVHRRIQDGWKVVRSKKRTCKIWDGHTTRKIEFGYRVLKKDDQISKPLLEELNIEPRRRYTQQARKESAVQAVLSPTYRKAAQLCQASRMSIWHWVQQQSISSENVKAYQGKEDYLVCESDRFYCSIRGESQKQPLHLGITYAGKNEIGSNGNRPYRKLVRKRMIIAKAKDFTARFEGEIHDQIHHYSIVYYNSDQGEPAHQRAKHVKFTDTFTDLFHLKRLKDQEGHVPSHEWEKSVTYKGDFGSCESNVKVVKSRLKGRTWSHHGIERFIDWMSYILGDQRSLKRFEPPKKKVQAKGAATDHYHSYLSQSQKNDLFHSGGDGLIPNRSIDSGRTP